MIDVTINIAIDMTTGLLCHFIAPPLPMAISPSNEMLATQMWPPGYALNQNKLTKKIFHKGFFIVLDGHDIGALIPDLTPANMANAYYAVMWPFSSRKIAFNTSKVEMEKTPVGCTQPFAVPLPMMTCGDPVSAPTAFPFTNKFNTVVVGMTIRDLIAGLVGIAISVAIDLIFHFATGKTPRPIAFRNALRKKFLKEFEEEVVERETKVATKKMVKELFKEAAGKVVPTSWSAALKTGLAGLSGFASSSIQGNPTYKVAVGSWPAGLEGGYSWGDKPGFQAKGNILYQQYGGQQSNKKQ